MPYVAVPKRGVIEDAGVNMKTKPSGSPWGACASGASFKECLVAIREREHYDETVPDYGSPPPEEFSDASDGEAGLQTMGATDEMGQFDDDIPADKGTGRTMKRILCLSSAIATTA
jgi:hypothetical protein